MFKTSEFNSQPERVQISGAAVTGVVTVTQD